MTATTPSATQPSQATYQYKRRVFQIHAAVFALAMVFLFLVNLILNLAAGLTGEWWAWWSVLALFGWGLGVTIHGLAVQISRPEGIGAA